MTHLTHDRLFQRRNIVTGLMTVSKQALKEE